MVWQNERMCSTARFALVSSPQGLKPSAGSHPPCRLSAALTILTILALTGAASFAAEVSPFPSYVASQPLSLKWYCLDFSRSDASIDVSELADTQGFIDVSRPVRTAQSELPWVIPQAHRPGMYVFAGSEHPASDTIWFYAEFDVATPAPLLWQYDADDAVRVWANGRYVWHKPYLNGVATPSFTTLIFPRLGKNTLLARVDNRIGLRTFLTDLRPVISLDNLKARISSVCRALLEPRNLEALVCMMEALPRRPLAATDIPSVESWNQDFPACPFEKLLIAFQRFSRVYSRNEQRRYGRFLGWLIEQSGVAAEIDRRLARGLQRQRTSSRLSPERVRRLFMSHRIAAARLGARRLWAYGTLPDDLRDLLLQSLTAQFQRTLSWETYMEGRFYADALEPDNEPLRQLRLAAFDFINTDVASAVERLDRICREQPDLEPAFHLRSISLLQHYPIPLPQCPEAFQAWREKARREDEKLYRSLIR